MSSESPTLSRSQSGASPDGRRFANHNEAFEHVYRLFGRKWHVRIVYWLQENGPMGFSALKREISGISSKMLSESLSRLETDGIVDRSVVSERPIRVEYTLTERGQGLEPVLAACIGWSQEFGPESDHD